MNSINNRKNIHALFAIKSLIKNIILNVIYIYIQIKSHSNAIPVIGDSILISTLEGIFLLI